MASNNLSQRLIKHTNNLIQFTKYTFLSPYYWIGSVLFLIAFYITRLPIYEFFPFPAYAGDSHSYIIVAEAISKGEWPDLFTRTPGYPIYLWITSSLYGGKYFGIMIWNSILFALSGLFMISAFHYWNKKFALVLGFIMALFCFNSSTLRHEFLIYADSPACSIVIASFAMLLIALKSRNTLCVVFYSVLAGVSILFKPGNLYLLVIIGLVCFYMWVHKYSLKSRILIFVPTLSMILIVMFYNWCYHGFFSYIPESDHTKLFATHWYLEESSEYPDDVNQMIRKSLASVHPEDLKKFKNTWELDLFRWRFHHYSEISVYPFFKSSPELKPWLSKITGDAIKKYPSYYLKHFLTMMKAYFFLNTEMENKYSLKDHFYKEIEAHRHLTDLKREGFVNVYEPKTLAQYKEEGHFIDQPYLFYEVLHATILPIIKNSTYTYMFFLIFLLSAWRCYKTQMKEFWPFFILLICLANIGSAMIISLSVPPFLRYSYPYDYLHYLCPFFFFLLLSSDLKAQIKNISSQLVQKFSKKQKIEFIVFSSIFCLCACIFVARSMHILALYKSRPGLAVTDVKLSSASLTNYDSQDFLYFASKFINLKKYDRAEDVLSRMLYLQPQHLEAKLMRAHLFRKQNNFDGALNEYNSILSINPKFAKAYYALGEMFMLVKKQDKMIEVFKMARRQIPDFHPKQFQKMNPQQSTFWDKILSQ